MLHLSTYLWHATITLNNHQTAVTESIESIAENSFQSKGGCFEWACRPAAAALNSMPIPFQTRDLSKLQAMLQFGDVWAQSTPRL